MDISYHIPQPMHVFWSPNRTETGRWAWGLLREGGWGRCHSEVAGRTGWWVHVWRMKATEKGNQGNSRNKAGTQFCTGTEELLVNLTSVGKIHYSRMYLCLASSSIFHLYGLCGLVLSCVICFLLLVSAFREGFPLRVDHKSNDDIEGSAPVGR